MPKKKKPLMTIGMAGRNVTYTGNYNVNWGTTKNSYNNSTKVFKKRTPAIKFVKSLKKKFKPKYKVNYIYMSG